MVIFHTGGGVGSICFFCFFVFFVTPSGQNYGHLTCTTVCAIFKIVDILTQIESSIALPPDSIVTVGENLVQKKILCYYSMHHNVALLYASFDIVIRR